MAKKINWFTLSHEDQIRTLAEKSLDQIVEVYGADQTDEAAFRQLLGRQVRLWSPSNVAKFRHAGKPPTKDVVLGAWRDLDRSEALLELIDNSIDVWLQRRSNYPKKTAPELNIYISVDAVSRQLTYEDNAGGVSIDKLENLVVPGFSDTTALTKTIGSYKTGGKKAVFRLAMAAQIMTRYWNPAETNDDAIGVHLDESWINEPQKYEFSYAILKDKAVLEKGQTRYLLQLREEPIGGTQWFEQPTEMDKIVKEIRSAYTLLMVRNPAIHIYFQNRAQPLEPLEELYEFSGAHDSKFDIRPQQVTFETEMEYEGLNYPVEIEVVLGCRKTTGVRSGRTGGIDLYGNDRQFVAYDQVMFSDFFPAGQVRNMIRGFVNIKGPNVFIPWDTHKRHLNVDRDIINLVKKNLLIRQLFENWKTAYAGISRSPEGPKTVSAPLPQTFDRTAKDIFIPHRARISLDPKKKRGISLPTSGFFVPKVPTKPKRKDGVNITLKFTTNEARLVTSNYGIEGDLHAKSTISELAVEIKADVLKRAARSHR